MKGVIFSEVVKMYLPGVSLLMIQILSLNKLLSRRSVVPAIQIRLLTSCFCSLFTGAHQ